MRLGGTRDSGRPPGGDRGRRDGVLLSRSAVLGQELHLYRYGFVDFHHEELAEALRWLREPWLLSYDLADEVVELYEKHDVRRANVELLYTGAQRAGVRGAGDHQPARAAQRHGLWHTKAEWKHCRRAAARR